jgi:hypothetical protein
MAVLHDCLPPAAGCSVPACLPLSLPPPGTAHPPRRSPAARPRTPPRSRRAETPAAPPPPALGWPGSAAGKRVEVLGWSRAQQAAAAAAAGGRRRQPSVKHRAAAGRRCPDRPGPPTPHMQAGAGLREGSQHGGVHRGRWVRSEVAEHIEGAAGDAVAQVQAGRKSVQVKSALTPCRSCSLLQSAPNARIESSQCPEPAAPPSSARQPRCRARTAASLNGPLSPGRSRRHGRSSVTPEEHRSS